MILWVDPEHPEINLGSNYAVEDLLEQLSSLLYEDDYIRIEELSVKEDT